MSEQGTFEIDGSPHSDDFSACGCDSWPTEPCPECGGKYLVEKVTKKAGAEKRCPNPECHHRQALDAA